MSTRAARSTRRTLNSPSRYVFERPRYTTSRILCARAIHLLPQSIFAALPACHLHQFAYSLWSNVHQLTLSLFLWPPENAQKICSLRGWPVGHAKNTETHESMLTIWEGLRSKADKDNDGQVSYSWRLGEGGAVCVHHNCLRTCAVIVCTHIHQFNCIQLQNTIIIVCWSDGWRSSRPAASPASASSTPNHLEHCVHTRCVTRHTNPFPPTHTRINAAINLRRERYSMPGKYVLSLVYSRAVFRLKRSQNKLQFFRSSTPCTSSEMCSVCFCPAVCVCVCVCGRVENAITMTSILGSGNV